MVTGWPPGSDQADDSPCRDGQCLAAVGTDLDAIEPVVRDRQPAGQLRASGPHRRTGGGGSSTRIRGGRPHLARARASRAPCGRGGRCPAPTLAGRAAWPRRNPPGGALGSSGPAHRVAGRPLARSSRPARRSRWPAVRSSARPRHWRRRRAIAYPAAARPTIATSTRAADSPAIAGRRRHHIQARAVVETGRAVTGSPLSHRFRSSASSRADRVPPPRLLLQAFQADHLQVARDLAVEPRGRLGRSSRGPLAGCRQRCRPRTAPARQQGVEDGAQAVDVGRRRDRAATAQRLLRGHVGGRPHDRAGLGQLDALLEPLGQAEVGDVRLALLVQQDVRRLEVAVQDAPLVGVLDGLGHLGQQRPRRPAGRPCSASSRSPRLPPAISFMLKYFWPSCSPTS